MNELLTAAGWVVVLLLGIAGYVCSFVGIPEKNHRPLLIGLGLISLAFILASCLDPLPIG